MLRAATHPFFEVVLAVVIALAHAVLHGAARELQCMQGRTSSPCRDADRVLRLNDCSIVPVLLNANGRQHNVQHVVHLRI